VCLNSLALPYWPQCVSNGFAKVSIIRQTKSSAGPTFQKLVERRLRHSDGTRTPAAVIHVNNFYAKIRDTLPFASIAFGDTTGRVRLVHGPAKGKLNSHQDGKPWSWRYSVYEIQSRGADS
jgi:hypothetical protein